MKSFFLATKPLDSKHKRSEDKFKTSSDGRLIISEDGQDDPLKGTFVCIY